MNTEKQSEALELADYLQKRNNESYYKHNEVVLSAAELRRQHSRIAELEAQLEAVGAGKAEQKPVAWMEFNESLESWFLAYSHNPSARTRPLVFGDAIQPAQPLQQSADDVLDAARYRWLAAYLVSDDAQKDDALIAAGTVAELSEVVDVARSAEGAQP